MVQLKAKGLEELSVRYAQPAIASLMKLGGSMLQALQSRLYWGGNGTKAGLLSCVFQAWKWPKLGMILLSISHSRS